jgi:small subunit ribosomal protein S6
MKPNMVDEDIDKIVNTIEDSIVQNNGEMICKPLVEKKKLAYQIEKFSDGYYAFFYFMGNPGINKRINEICRYNENILRYINFQLESRNNVLKSMKDKSVPSNEVPKAPEGDDDEEGE